MMAENSYPTDAMVEAMEAVIEGECNGLAIDRNILREAFIAAERAAWRPISEAPMDRTPVLVVPSLWSSRQCDEAHFDDDRYANRPRPFWRRAHPAGVTQSRNFPPVMFRHLPLPPEEKEDGK